MLVCVGNEPMVQPPALRMDTTKGAGTLKKDWREPIGRKLIVRDDCNRLVGAWMEKDWLTLEMNDTLVEEMYEGPNEVESNSR